MTRYDHVNRSALKAEARRSRRQIDREIVRRALQGEDVPSHTRNAEVADRWSHD